MVYSDSIFWMSERTYKPLLGWYSRNSPLQEELCCFLHMLPCLGKRTKEKMSSLERNSMPPTDFSADMMKILKDYSLRIVVMNDSRFTHFGTLQEYLQNFSYNEVFAQEMSIERKFCNLQHPWADSSKVGDKNGLVVFGTNFLDENCRMSSARNCHAVIEWCDIAMPLAIQNNVILSNCHIETHPSVKYMTKVIQIFGNTLYHTVPISDSGSSYYVTFAINLDADIKFSSSDLTLIQFFDLPMSEVRAILGLKLPPHERCSVWNIKFFPRAPSPAESFWLTHNMVNRLLSAGEGVAMETQVQKKDVKLYSFSDICKLKDLDVLMSHQEALTLKISSTSKN